jgi:hypothetical protein
MPSDEYDAVMTEHWLQSGIGPREIWTKLHVSHADVGSDEGAIQNLEARWRKRPGAFGIILGILGGVWNRLAGFDCEDIKMPADHARVVVSLAAITGNKFVVHDVTQTVEPGDKLKLALVHEGKTHSFTFEDNGTWLNLSGLLSSLNIVLQELDIRERFIELYAGDGGAALVTFARPDSFLAVARELGIRLELPPTFSSARRNGWDSSIRLELSALIHR